MPTLRKDPVAQASPITTRTQVMLEIASRMATVQEDRQFGQAKIYLRKQGTTGWPVCLFASNTAEGIDAVVKREADVAIVNPTTPLALAVRGKGPYATPQPVRAIAVIPSQDQYVFAGKLIDFEALFPVYVLAFRFLKRAYGAEVRDRMDHVIRELTGSLDA